MKYENKNKWWGMCLDIIILPYEVQKICFWLLTWCFYHVTLVILPTINTTHVEFFWLQCCNMFDLSSQTFVSSYCNSTDVYIHGYNFIWLVATYKVHNSHYKQSVICVVKCRKIQIAYNLSHNYWHLNLDYIQFLSIKTRSN